MREVTELGPVALPGRDGAWTVTLADGRVASIEAAAGEPEQLLLPAFADLHVHADRAFVRGPHPPRSLEDAIQMTEAIRAAATAELMRARAERLISAAFSHGSTQHVCVNQPLYVDPSNSAYGLAHLRTTMVRMDGTITVTPQADGFVRMGQAQFTIQIGTAHYSLGGRFQPV